MNYGKIHEFLNLPGDFYSKLRIRLNDKHGEALKSYLNNREKFETQDVLWYSGKKWFSKGDIAASFVKLHDDDWLLTSIHKITEEVDFSSKTEEEVNTGFPGWKSEILPEYERYYGTLHVKFCRSRRFQCQVPFYKTVEDFIQVSKLDVEPFTGDEFPGSDNVNLSWADLSRIFTLNKNTWINGLKNSKAVYLITDKKTKKMYVGSAASDDEMLLSRWKSYITNGHGGNKYFKKLIQEYGIEYIQENFEYSIIEPHDYRADINFLLERENYWKKVLHTKIEEGGMNYN